MIDSLARSSAQTAKFMAVSSEVNRQSAALSALEAAAGEEL